MKTIQIVFTISLAFFLIAFGIVIFKRQKEKKEQQAKSTLIARTKKTENKIEENGTSKNIKSEVEG